MVDHPAGHLCPLLSLLLTKFMRRIPSSLIEAAKLDGASEWRIFTRICLPQCRSALYSIAILVFIDYWNMVEQPIILLSDPDKQPLSVYLSTINAGEVGIAFASSCHLYDSIPADLPAWRGISRRKVSLSLRLSKRVISINTNTRPRPAG